MSFLPVTMPGLGCVQVIGADRADGLIGGGGLVGGAALVGDFACGARGERRRILAQRNERALTASAIRANR